MNRMEEAFRRAQRDSKLPASGAPLHADGIEQFQPVEEPQVEQLPAPVLDIETAESDGLDPGPDAAVASAVLSTDNGDVPSVSTALSRASAGKLVVSDGIRPAVVEQYRRLAAALHHAQCNDGIKIVMVASALAGEGKTLTSVNLALTLSESYARRVLLIDADLRRPTLHEVFQLPNLSGLNEGLKSNSDRKLTVLEISPRLSLLPAGKPDPDPMSALTSDRMQRMIQEAASKFDWVVLDTPPVGLLPDANLLAAMVHVAVLVVQADRTPFELIQRAVETLDRKRIIGVVLNRVEDRALSPAGKYEQYYAASYGRKSDPQADAQA